MYAGAEEHEPNKIRTVRNTMENSINMKAIESTDSIDANERRVSEKKQHTQMHHVAETL